MNAELLQNQGDYLARISSGIKYSKDYSAFKFIEGNRNISERHVRDIIKKINEIGFIPMPIVVNENMEIAEGQHRFEALKRLGLPIPYIIVPGVGMKEIVALNTSSMKWSTSDYIDSFASNHKASYQRLKQLMRDFNKDGARLECVLAFINPAHRYMKPKLQKRITEGMLKLSKERFDFVRIRLNRIIDLGVIDYQKSKKIPADGFYAAISYAFDHPDVDAIVLIKKILIEYDLPHFRGVGDMLRVFDDINNKGKRAEKRVFMEADFKKGLYLPDTEQE